MVVALKEAAVSATTAATSTSAADCALQLSFRAQDASIRAGEARAKAEASSDAAERAANAAQNEASRAQNAAEKLTKELAHTKEVQQEKRRMCTFLGNQINSAKEEASRAAASFEQLPGGAAAEDIDDEDCCRICLDPYDDRVMTPCLHSFCNECILGYLQSSAGRACCPICRQPVSASQLQKVSAPVLIEDTSDRNSAKITYLILQIKQQIGGAPSNKPFKCVIFSSWTRVLDIVAEALSEAGIGFDAFYKDRELAVENFSHCPLSHALLVSMRGTSDSGAAGLTLTMASHAFLMEPMMNFGLEAQAIGRINRIGQTSPPTIERILVEDTIEQQILRLADKKRSLQSTGCGAGNEAIKTAEVEEIFGL